MTIARPGEAARLAALPLADVGALCEWRPSCVEEAVRLRSDGSTWVACCERCARLALEEARL